MANKYIVENLRSELCAKSKQIEELERELNKLKVEGMLWRTVKDIPINHNVWSQWAEQGSDKEAIVLNFIYHNQ